MSTIPINELRALKAKLDHGEITDDQFQKEKRRLLGLGDISSSIMGTVEKPQTISMQEPQVSDEERELQEANKRIRSENSGFIYRDAVRVGKYDYNRWIMQYIDKKFSFSRMVGSHDKELLTPNFNKVTTVYKAVADKIMDDFDHYGVDEYSVREMVYWHCTTIDLNIGKSRNDVEKIVVATFLNGNDWILNDTTNSSRTWKLYFGESASREREIRNWLSKCSGMQLGAVYCMSLVYGSINLAYALAKVVEQKDESQWKSSFDEIYQLIGKKTFKISLAQSIVFNNFAFYYNIHVKENGTIIH